MYAISKIITCLKPIKQSIVDSKFFIDTLSYDTRKIRTGDTCLFFALVDQRDGHRFIEDAYNKSVRNFIISDLSLDVALFPQANFLWVDNTLQAMQSLAQDHRESLSIPIIGITGSNGKTIVKEWLSQLLREEINVYQSPNSYNSQLGVALSLWNISTDHDLALIEAGISKVGEMASLARMIQPTLGILTSLGTAHKEGFPSKESKLEEKWKLFARTDKIIVPSSQIPASYLEDPRIVSWGDTTKDQLQVLRYEIVEHGTNVDLAYEDLTFSIAIPFTDKASVVNALTCVLTLLELGYDKQIIIERITRLRPLQMRLQLKKGKNNSSIIDDTYSNDLASLNIALDFLNQQNQFDQKKLVLSDFEGEEWTIKFKTKLTHLLSTVKLKEIILIGNRFRDLSLDSNILIRIFDTTDDLLENITDLDFSNAVVLIKGARKYKLEQLSRKLTEKSHETILQINLKSLEHNLKEYRAKLNPKVKLMAMVKAFSYGSGSYEVANVLQFNNVDYLTVAFVDEGVELRRAGVKLPIMVLSPHEGTFEDILLYDLEPEIYSKRILKSFIKFLSAKQIQNYPIHIKLDTGMHRLGFVEAEVEELLAILKNQKEVLIQSAFSHLVGAGEASLSDFTTHQIDLYNRLVIQIESSVGYTFIKHICNTSGILHHPESHLDMVRLGIGLYGYDMNPKDISLEEVGALKTTITQIKNVPQNETIGYDRKGKLFRDSIIATVKIGYADGYNRRFGNGVGEMMINGQIVRTVGNICMDMCMLDITNIHAKEGDEVFVFPDLSKAAKDICTIPYEILTGISSRVKRVYYYE